MKCGIAIDFGTTNTCISFANSKGHEPQTITINGKNYAPTNLTYLNDETPVALFDVTKLQYPPGNCIHNIKRIIGKKIDNPDIQKRKKFWDFTLVKDERGMAAYQVEDKGKKIIVKPEEAASKIFSKLLTTLKSTQLDDGTDVSKLVLTIPVAFTAEQCERIKTAAKAAGFDIIGTIYEPTAAAILFGMMTSKDGKIMIFDFGGGTLDVTIMDIKTKEGTNTAFFETIAESGDPNLGGEAIDEILMDHFEGVLKKNGIDIRSGTEEQVKKNLQLHKEICREIKEHLSYLTSYTFNWRNASIPVKDATIRKARFEEMLDDHGIDKRINAAIDNCLKAAKIDAKDIKAVICSGGSSVIPYVKDILNNIFGEKVLCDSNPELTIAKGASIYARALLNGEVRGIDGTDDGNKPQVKPDVPQVEIVTSCALNYALGYIDAYGDFDEIFEKGAKIPAKRSINAYSAEEYLPNMITKVCYRENYDSDLLELMTYTVDFEGRRGQKVTETWSLDAGGNLTIQSTLIVTGKSVSNKVSVSNLYFTQQEMQQLRDTANEYREALENDDKIKELERTIDREIADAKKMCEKRPAVKNSINKELEPILEWLDEGTKGRTQSDYQNQLKSVRRIVMRYRNSIY